MQGVATRRPSLFRPDSPIAYAVQFVVYLSVTVRVVLRTPQEGLVSPWVYGLLAVYLVFSVAQPPISRRWALWTHLHLAVLSAVICTLILTEPRLDYYALLFLGLSIVAAGTLPQGADLIWLAVMCVLLTLALLAAFGPREAASFAPIYVAGPLIMSIAARESRKAEEARAKAKDLLGRLTGANRRLREYAEQAEEAAAAQERARLARDLHDAATQTVFSMNLTAEAARIALDQDPGRVPGMLERLQALARDALAEMRALVDQLRPQSIGDVGLVKTLQRHIAMRERRDGLKVTLSVEGAERGDPVLMEVLFKSAREALSNVLKHAGVSAAGIMLRFDEQTATLRVSDAGRGFDPDAERRPEGFGLMSLSERVASLHGSAEVRSAPGKGTEVEVRLPLAGGMECRENPSSPSV
jgi:signal transduction histidine kinase